MTTPKGKPLSHLTLFVGNRRSRVKTLMMMSLTSRSKCCPSVRRQHRRAP